MKCTLCIEVDLRSPTRMISLFSLRVHACTADLSGFRMPDAQLWLAQANSTLFISTRYGLVVVNLISCQI